MDRMQTIIRNSNRTRGIVAMLLSLLGVFATSIGYSAPMHTPAVVAACRQMALRLVSATDAPSTMSPEKNINTEIASLKAMLLAEKENADRKTQYKIHRKELDKERFCEEMLFGMSFMGLVCKRYADEDEKLGVLRNECLQERMYSPPCEQYEKQLLTKSIQERIRINKDARQKAEAEALAKKNAEKAVVEKKAAEKKAEKSPEEKTIKVLSAEEKRRILEKELAEVRVCEKHLRAFVNLRCMRYADETAELARERVLCENDAGINDSCSQAKRLFESVSIEARIQLNKEVRKEREIPGEKKAAVEIAPTPAARAEASVKPVISRPLDTPAKPNTAKLASRMGTKQRTTITDPVCESGKQKKGYCERYRHENLFEAYARLRCMEAYIHNFDTSTELGKIRARACSETIYEIAGLPVHEQVAKAIIDNDEVSKDRLVLVESALYDRNILEMISNDARALRVGAAKGISPVAKEAIQAEARAAADTAVMERDRANPSGLTMSADTRAKVDQIIGSRPARLQPQRFPAVEASPAAEPSSALPRSAATENPLPQLKFDLGDSQKEAAGAAGFVPHRAGESEKPDNEGEEEKKEEEEEEVIPSDLDGKASEELLDTLVKERKCSHAVSAADACNKFLDESEEEAKNRLACFAQTEPSGAANDPCTLYNEALIKNTRERIAKNRNQQVPALVPAPVPRFSDKLGSPDYLGPILHRRSSDLQPASLLLQRISLQAVTYPRMMENGKLCLAGTPGGICTKFYESIGPVLTKPVAQQPEQQRVEKSEPQVQQVSSIPNISPLVVRGASKRNVFRVIYRFNEQLSPRSKMSLREVNALANEIIAEEARGGWTAAESLAKMFKESAFNKAAVSDQYALGLMQIHVPPGNPRQKAGLLQIIREAGIQSNYPDEKFEVQLMVDPVFNYQVALALNDYNRRTYGVVHRAMEDTCYYVGCNKLLQTVSRLRGVEDDRVVWSVLRNGDPNGPARGSKDGYHYAKDTYLKTEYMKNLLENPDSTARPEHFQMSDHDFFKGVTGLPIKGKSV